jgi:hypothetical protein
MVIILTMSFPVASSTEAGKCMLNLPPLPSYMTMKGPFVNPEVGSGQKIMALFEFDQTKTGEVMELLGNRYVPYFGVPGFTYNIALWFEAKEALKMIGLA